MLNVKKIDTNQFNRRELKSLNRFENGYETCELLRNYFMAGFTNLDAIKALMKVYYPNQDLSQLYDFWHLRIYNKQLFDCLENVLEKLKQE